ncbi:MAG: flippase-like domain-containing protein, partial [Gemmatimonadetes bacterium]|nr:flippase-like domain-containing protein [Gemmatimonadota bacterium]
ASASPRGGAVEKTHGALDWQAIVGIAISVGLLAYVFRGVDLRDVADEITRADPWLLIAATAAATSVFWVRAWRWRSILTPVDPDTSFRARFAAVNIGFMANNLLPARVGEFARAYALSRVTRVPVVAGLSSLVVERLLDALFLVLALFATMALPGFPPWPSDAGVNFPAVARTLGLVAASIAIILFLLVLKPQIAVRWLEALARRVLPGSFRRPVIDALEAFLAGAGVLRQPQLMMRAIGWTVIVWFLNGLGFWLAFHAFDLQLSMTAAFFFQSCLAFAVSIPAAPGFFGTYEAAASVVLVELWGREATRALGFAIGFHIAGFIPVTLIGLFYAWKLGLSLRGVAHSEEVVEEEVERATGAGTT